MTNEELQDLLDRADEALTASNYVILELLASKVLNDLELQPELSVQCLIYKAHALSHLGTVSRLQGDYSQALTHYTNSLTAGESASDQLSTARAKMGLGMSIKVCRNLHLLLSLIMMRMHSLRL
ncbi:MAG: hypothetical protein IPM69_13410 [Ignavibacteria bacterium]|nr:hypothetical protein [Ignavibacteria bacterium]